MNREDISLFRTQRNLSQRVFAELIGIAQSDLSEIETGKRTLTPYMEKRIKETMGRYDRGYMAMMSKGLNEEKPNTLYETFHKVATDIANTLSEKNHDYGDSFFDVYKKFGDQSTYIRLADKLGRMETLISGKEVLVKNEPLEDVLRDIAGYCILTLVSKTRLKQQEE